MPNDIPAPPRGGQTIRPRQEPHLRFTIERSTVCGKEEPPLRCRWSDDLYRTDYNLYLGVTGGESVRFGEWSLDG